MSLQRVPINNFRGGLNTRDGPFDLQPNESPDLLNVTISALVGQLESRKGRTRLDKSGLPNATVDFMKQVVLSNGVRFLMCSINGAIWRINPAGEAKELFKGTAGTIWDFEQFADTAFKDWVWMSNGVDAPQKWDGIAAASVEWKATKGVLPNGGVLCVWENRMFISFVTANVQRIFFSEFGDPEATLEEYGFLDVRGPEDDLDAVQDLAVLGSRLFVMKRRSVFMITSAVTMQNRRVGGPGAWARFQTVEMEDKLYFFNPQGLWSTGGVQISMESGSINNYFPQHLNVAEAHKARLVATKDTYPRLLLALPTDGAVANDKLIELIPHINFRRIGGRRYLLLPAFMLHSMPTTALATWNPTAAEELIVGTSKAAAAPTFFEALAVTDSFIRANENPLSNAGKWKAVKITEEEIGATNPFIFGNKLAAPLNKTVGSVWQETVAEPVVTAFCAGGGELSEIGLIACWTEAEGSSFYKASWFKKAFGSPGGIIVERILKGKWVTILTVELAKAITEGDEVGLAVNLGKVYVGIKYAGGVWETMGFVGDANLTTGFTGIIVGNFKAGGKAGFYEAKNFAKAVSKITASSSTISRMFNGTTDEGTPIEAKYQTSWMSIQGEEPKERMRRLNVELSGDAIVDVFTDFGEIPAFSKALPLSAEGEGTQYRFVRLRPETHGRFHSIRFKSNVAAKPFLINAAEAVVRGGKEH